MYLTGHGGSLRTILFETCFFPMQVCLHVPLSFGNKILSLQVIKCQNGYFVLKANSFLAVGVERLDENKTKLEYLFPDARCTCAVYIYSENSRFATYLCRIEI